MQYEILKNFWVEIKPATVGRDLKIIRKDRLGKIYRRFVIETDGGLIPLNFAANSLNQKTNSLNVMVICSDLSSEEKQLLKTVLSSRPNSEKLKLIFSKPDLLKIATRKWALRKRDGLNFRDLSDIPELKISRSTFQRTKKNFEAKPEPKKNVINDPQTSVDVRKFRPLDNDRSQRKNRDTNQQELF